MDGREDSGVEVHFRRTTIAFVPAARGEDPRYHFAINVPRFRLPDAFNWLRERVDPLPLDDGEVVIRFEDTAADAVYFLDSGGNVVELTARDTLANDDDRPFASSLLLEVSEIGLATADVPATRNAVLAALEAPIYWGGFDDDRLTAIGDAVGTVLIAPLGRCWFPIDLQALPAPTTIVAGGLRDGTYTILGGPYVIQTVAAQARTTS